MVWLLVGFGAVVTLTVLAAASLPNKLLIGSKTDHAARKKGDGGGSAPFFMGGDGGSGECADGGGGGGD